MPWNSLIQPKSIAVIGGSDRLDHLGGSIVHNLLSSGFKGDIYIVNPKRDTVQGLSSFRDPKDLPKVELAIFAIPAEYIYKTAKLLITTKNTSALIVFSAGFSEVGADGRQAELKLVQLCKENGVRLLGPNCIGLCNQNYTGLFTRPVPKLDPQGVDFISSSGATAVFTIELASEIGLNFSSLYTIGNAAMLGVEDILEYFDSIYDRSDKKVIMIYMEGLKNPDKFILHSRSLYEKGHRITLLKGGTTQQGNQAASSHTGALARNIETEDSIFQRSGVIRCHSRSELIYTAAIINNFDHLPKRIGIITHAGGPAVLLTDGLIKNGLQVPCLEKSQQTHLKKLLYDGANTSNPIDILATGTSEHLEQCLEYCDKEVDEIDGLVVILGSPGLTDMTSHFKSVLSYSKICSKPLFTILPSVVNTDRQRNTLSKNGLPAFKDERLFANSLGAICRNTFFPSKDYSLETSVLEKIKELIDPLPAGYIHEEHGAAILDLLNIRRASQQVISSIKELTEAASSLEYPVVLKACGIQHKTDHKAVFTHLNNVEQLHKAYESICQIDQITHSLIQPQLFGEELYIGALRDSSNIPLVFCGKGGIHLESYGDIQHGMAPISIVEANSMIEKLRIYPILKGTRGEIGIDTHILSLYVAKIAALTAYFPRIIELDLNPLIANSKSIQVVDIRLRLGPQINP